MYHKIIDKDGNIIGISANDEDNILDENWIEISEEEYEEAILELQKQNNIEVEDIETEQKD